ncbi:MAG: hypothetical protein LBS66_02270 [Rhodospirillaceae bacterium]|jgi:hypothetical protein|nr:hypothetical protein [Rhodospirillaceae bacterium]
MIIELTLQSRGGVGKTIVSAILTQYFQLLNRSLFCIDADILNPNFSKFKNLNAELFTLGMDTSNDDWKQLILRAEDINSEHLIIDIPSSLYIPIWSQLTKGRALANLNHEVRFHYLFINTEIDENGLSKIVDNFLAEPIVVWIHHNLNETKTRELLSNKYGINKFIYLSKRYDLKKIFTNHLTFKEIIKSSTLSIYTKQNIILMLRELYQQMEEAGL